MELEWLVLSVKILLREVRVDMTLYRYAKLYYCLFGGRSWGK